MTFNSVGGTWGLGGTADVVQYAISKKKRLIHINPTDRTVEER